MFYSRNRLKVTGLPLWTRVWQTAGSEMKMDYDEFGTANSGYMYVVQMRELVTACRYRLSYAGALQLSA